MLKLKLLVVSVFSVLMVCALAANFVGGEKARASGSEAAPAPDVQAACPDAKEHELPLPTTLAPGDFVAFEKRVLEFLQNGEYNRQLGWCRDKGVRDTGPFRDKVYYGSHPAVRIFYSPKMMDWLTGGRIGPVPDGAMMIKEQYPPPAARYADVGDDGLKPTDWTVMIKDSKGAKDGWFWGEWYVGMTFDDDAPPFQYPNAGFGLYCLRCHATAETEFTFSALRNIQGFPGEPIFFEDDGSWRDMLPTSVAHQPRLPAPPPRPETEADPEFLNTFNSIPNVPLADVAKLPSETYDHVVAPAGDRGEFVSSTQCMSCHGALSDKSAFGPVMFLLPSHQTPGSPQDAAVGANVSPYGEWRWSPMGLAGRDPIFFAQVESELAFINTLPPPENEQVSAKL